MLTVHINRSAEFKADAEREEKARVILQRKIDEAKSSTAAILDRIATEVPRDRIAPVSTLSFTTTDNRLQLTAGEETQEIHRHAIQQAASRGSVNIPSRFIDDLLTTDEWSRELLAHNLNETLSHTQGRYLLRSVNNEVRGFLSDRFRRLDTAPIVEAMITEAGKRDAVVLSAHDLATKWRLRLLLPDLFEPVPGEVVAYGLSFGNSDYGDGALHMSAFLLRVWCMNGAVADEIFRQVHVGGRLADDIAFSKRTYRLDTMTTVSAVRDFTRNVLDVEKVTAYMTAIQDAAGEELDAKKAIAALRSRNLVTTTEAQAVAETYNSADIIELPAGQNRWRLSNAISLIGRNRLKEGEERRGIELQELAGRVLAKAA
jgi:hypothetical protein